MPSILIVEDNVNVADVFANGLKLGGYEAEIAMSGAEAEQKIQTKTYDFIIMDLSLPDVNGAEIAAKLRGYGCTAPMVAVTGAAPFIDPQLIADAGFEAVLGKPIRISALVDYISKYLEPTTPAAGVEENKNV